jgi:hypothetical protein
VIILALVIPNRTIAFVKRLATTVTALSIAASGCGAPQPRPSASPARSPGPAISPSPAPSGVLGHDWEKAELVEQRPGDPLRTQDPYSGGLGHPARYQGGQADVLDVVAGGLGDAAVGTGGTPERPTAALVWTWHASADGRTWTRAPDPPSLANFGLPIEMRDVTLAGSTYIAVGHLLFGT